MIKLKYHDTRISTTCTELLQLVQHTMDGLFTGHHSQTPFYIGSLVRTSLAQWNGLCHYHMSIGFLSLCGCL